MNLKSLDLQLVLCPVREPEKKYVHYYNKIYNCWHEIWSSTYAQLQCHEKDQDMKSDSFTRQDFAAALFHNDECVAVILFRHVDMSLLSTQKDSYFIQWSELHRRAIKKSGDRVLICGNLGVSPQFRKNALGVSLKDLLIGIVMEITVESAADVLIATPRRDKNVHGSGYDWGATPIAQDVDWGHGVRTDLVAVHKAHVIAQRHNHPLMALMSELWKQKIVVEEEQFESVNSFKLNKVASFKKAS